MPMFGLRYDLRCPPFARATPEELTTAALEQCAWADERGFATVTLSEHHGSPDGYLPSPLVLAAAIAARTRHMRIVLAALIAPLHDPIRLAEDLAVLDVVSGGRIVPVLAGGYVESEFLTFGRRLADRPQAMEEIVGILEHAWTGEPFEHRGTTVRVTPRPVQKPRPPLFMGGASPAAARRAARLADHFIPSVPGLFEVFREERRRLGRPDPGPLPPTTGNFLHVAQDPDAAWQRIAPHALHETNAYASWLGEPGGFSPYETAADAEALRRSGRYPVLTPEELIEKARALPAAGTVMLHPLMGGMDPELGWESLRLVESAVMPALL
jgi:alkanesulfonate monooxygenase SsuD/methylene tetrahydromethanopterin reductase-like flavin-dependent oxidoreductase (luciferase family)